MAGTPTRVHQALGRGGRQTGITGWERESRNVGVDQSCAVPVAGAQEGTAARRVRTLLAVTLSDTDGQGERAHSRLAPFPAIRHGRPWRAEQVVRRVEDAERGLRQVFG
jgi:hypothetical protein